MHYTENEIDLAKQLKEAGLEWDPQPGHYVWDENNLIEQDSPFQSNVYFILDLKHFLRRSSTLDNLKRSMVWLPTWEQARCLAKRHDITTVEQLAILTPEVLATGTERESLYRLVLRKLATVSE